MAVGKGLLKIVIWGGGILLIGWITYSLVAAYLEHRKESLKRQEEDEKKRQQERERKTQRQQEIKSKLAGVAAKKPVPPSTKKLINDLFNAVTHKPKE